MLRSDVNIIQENLSFTYDWNDYRTIPPNKDLIPNCDKSIIEASERSLTADQMIALGKLSFKVGTFHNHFSKRPDLALSHHEKAEKILLDKELAWVQNHIAFSYQQILANSQDKISTEAVEAGKKGAAYCQQIIRQHGTAEDKESIQITAFAYCVKALLVYEQGKRSDAAITAAIKDYGAALAMYEQHGLIDDQYARAKLRRTQFERDFELRGKLYKELEDYWAQRPHDDNPYAARFYAAYAEHLPDDTLNLDLILARYERAHKILLKTEGEQAKFTLEIGVKIAALKGRIEQRNAGAFDAVMLKFVQELSNLPFVARELVMESFITILARGIVPMSGMTVQQQIQVGDDILNSLNTLTSKKSFKNGADARYVYQFAREATSAGIVPVYRECKSGDLYVALVCNKRSIKPGDTESPMLNWSAGYTEAPLPLWNGPLRSEMKEEIYFNRQKIIESAKKTMIQQVKAAGGDWTKTEFGHNQFAERFAADGVTLPPIDINSLHTAVREAKEEINLDLAQYPEHKKFLISYDNTLGVSQGDAPGQVSNRSHQYMVYLGEFAQAPEIKPGSDVAIAKWFKVGDIKRTSVTEYSVQGHALCVYMLRGLEQGLKEVWNYLLQQASACKSDFSQKPLARFPDPASLAIEIERFCSVNGLNFTDTPISSFLKALIGEEPNRTYTGSSAQATLNCLLGVARYFMEPKLDPQTFIRDMTKLLKPTEAPAKIFGVGLGITHFQPISVSVSVPSTSIPEPVPEIRTVYYV